MFRQIFLTQWKWARLLVLAAAVCAFTIPLSSVQSLGGEVTGWVDGQTVLRAMRSYGGLYALLAAALGVAIAISSWSLDHRTRHVYALSLPVDRWRFALMRFGGGALLILIPAFALWVSALVATATVDIPPGLEAFPTSIAIRFAFAALVSFAIFFACAAGTVRTAGWVLGGVTVVVMMLVFAEPLHLPAMFQDVFERILFTWPGMFEVFTGRWMLIDV